MPQNNPTQPAMKSVFSSHINRIGHDPATGNLTVQWDTGKTSVYADVPENIARRVMNSPSIGSALHNEIKTKYSHRYLP